MLNVKETKSNYVVIGDDNNTFYFSYNTLIAFDCLTGLYIRKNVWGNTTGKHLDYVHNNKDIRVDKKEFELAYKRLINL